MKSLDSNAQLAQASLIGLMVLHLMMLVALFSHAELSPPAFVGPLNAAVIALQSVALLLIRYGLWAGRGRQDAQTQDVER